MNKHAGSVDSNNELARFILEQLKEHRLERAQALRFLNELSAKSAAATASADAFDDIAIIGMACRLPQAEAKEQFWKNLVAGRDSIRAFPLARRADLAAIDATGADLFDGGFLDSVDGFDNEYFRIPPVLARQIDPYQRLLMETLVETMEDAGYHRGAVYGKPIGVFVGNDHTHRFFNNYLAFIERPDFNSVTGSWTSVLASRISYLFNLKGPAVVVDTACSSGLVALDFAIKALRSGDCESALVGAANLFFAPGKGIVGEIENDDFQVRAFDRRASGTVWGEGVAAIMIKPLAHAVRDGDPVHAVIKGIALNNDGASNGLTAPNAKAQQDVILKAWERARINPEDISYIETHGTGTHLGDPIEIKGLVGAFEARSKRKQFCAIGSVKTNIGHTVGVAGLASLIKVVLSLKHKTIPPSINFAEPNPFIDFCNSPVYVNDRVLAWSSGARPRLAGISSFSMSGTNCHLLVQEAPVLAPPAAMAANGAPLYRLFPISARNTALFEDTVRRYLAHFSPQAGGGAEFDLADASFTAGVGREHHPIRAVLLISHADQLCGELVRLLALLERAGHCDGPSLFYGAGDGAAKPAAPGERAAREAALQGANLQEPDALRNLARLYVGGAPIKWEYLYRNEQRRRVHLPPQPFERKRFWATEPGQLAASAAPVLAAAALGLAAAAPPEANLSIEELVALVKSVGSRVQGVAEGVDALPFQVAAHIWTEVLGYRQVQLHEDFYALGGDSLTAIKIVQLFNALFRLDINVTDLLGAPNLHDFVGRLNQKYHFEDVLGGRSSRVAHAGYDVIAPLPAAGSYALSRAQKRMFLLERLSPGLTVYNVNAVVRLAALPDLAETGRIISQIMARHEILRTAFLLQGDELVQTICEVAPFQAEHILLAPAQSIAAHDAAVEHAIATFVRPFDIARPPLLRVGFIEDAAGACCMAIDMHHIVTDGSSMGVLVGEFLALQRGVTLAALPFQYKDFGAWQNRLFAQNALQEHKEFWLAQFADAAPTLDLQTDHARPGYQDFRGAKQHFLLDLALVQQLQELARAQGATLFMVLLAAFDTLLYKLGGGNDLVVGSPVAGRSRIDLHPLIGMFVNTLALRNRVEGNAPFSRFLARVKANTLAALEHQDYPYEELVEALAVPRNAGRNPLFDIYFAFQNEDMGLAHEADLETVQLDSGTAKFDMTVVARLGSAGMHIEWEYALSLYEASSISRMAAQFFKILRDITRSPETPVDEFDLLGAAERRTLLVDLNDTASAYPAAPGLAQLFEAQVAQHPDAVALEMDGTTRSYAQLNTAANRLAHRLRGAGAVPGQIIGLLYVRSCAMIEAILAVLKAGCAYIPLDADHPLERNQDMLGECGATLLLAGPGLIPPALPGLSVIFPESEDNSDLPGNNPAPAANGESLAYIIFTSGSTGRPKGTVIRQKSVARVVLNTNYVSLSAADRILQLSNYAFDGSVFDIWAALLNGGRLILLHKRELIDMDALSRIIVERKVTVFFITTALFNALVETRLDCLAGVRHVLFGGEAASVKHVARAVAALGPGRVIHVYGPTESTVFATAYAIQTLDLDSCGIPIGAPIANTRVYVLDAQLKLVPMGVAGELYIGGDGLALGYLGQEELTRERFLPDPFLPGERMYRSGDMVKWLAGGAILFLGRRDHQVKIRGYRIELGEIEAAIGRHANVLECVVSAEPDEHGDKQLCAHVVPQRPSTSFAQELRTFLGARLPEYMVPKAIISVPAFALNSNGKVDRSALPAAQPEQRDLVAARDEREALLVQIWCQLLSLHELSIHDNFFALGGDSIKAIQIVARLQSNGYAAQMPLLFKYQSIAELAPHLARDGACLVEQGPVSGALPLNPIQTWFLDSEPEQPQHFNHAMLISLSVLPAAHHVALALAAVCEHHDGLRAVFRRTDGIWEAHLREPSHVAFRVVQFEQTSCRPGNAKGEQCLLQLQGGLNLEEGPLVAVGLFQSDEGAALCMSVHHLVVDVVSWSVLLEDFQHCLRQIEQGCAPQLPPKTASVISWNRALHAYAASAQSKGSLAYWTQLAELRVAEICPSGQRCGSAADGRVVTLVLAAEVSAFAMGEANRSYTSEPLHLLLAAMGNALGLWRKAENFLVLLESHGRDGLPGMPDAGRTVGWFTAAFPFLLQYCADPGHAIKANKEALRNVPAKGLDFGVLRYLAGDLAPEQRAQLASMAPQIGFNFLGKMTGAASPGALGVQVLGRHLTMSQSTRLALPLDVIASFHDGRIELEALYDSRRLEAGQVRTFLDLFEAQLTMLVEHCGALPRAEKSASDFTVTKMQQKELDDIFSDLEII